ncbi:MAG TPA: 3-methyl-2-oxobutanoate hydroxymethyltransferase, partial [Sedimentisphaerales bacterium]|nr:3-methyl-2-oxobutanoate hydroxymethyltransferase [Sedimentisphaerales bacterium]
RRGAPEVCLVADMPFLSCQTGLRDALCNAGRFLTEAGAQLIKVEAGEAQIEVVKAMSNAGIGVIAHIGIRPQTVGRMGKLRVDGATTEAAAMMLDLADAMVDAGAVALLLEGTAREAAKLITQRVPVPVVGCGSGPDCDGQILVIADILGLSHKEMPKFAKQYVDAGKVLTAAIARYAAQVRSGRFPDDKHSYHVRKSEAAEFARWRQGQVK